MQAEGGENKAEADAEQASEGLKEDVTSSPFEGKPKKAGKRRKVRRIDWHGNILCLIMRSGDFYLR